MGFKEKCSYRIRDTLLDARCVAKGSTQMVVAIVQSHLVLRILMVIQTVFAMRDILVRYSGILGYRFILANVSLALEGSAPRSMAYALLQNARRIQPDTQIVDALQCSGVRSLGRMELGTNPAVLAVGALIQQL